MGRPTKVLPSRMKKNVIEVSGGPQILVLALIAEAAIATAHSLRDLARPVGRSVVRYQDVKVAECLSTDRLKRSLQISLAISDRQSNRDLGISNLAVVARD